MWTTSGTAREVAVLLMALMALLALLANIGTATVAISDDSQISSACCHAQRDAIQGGYTVFNTDSGMKLGGMPTTPTMCYGPVNYVQSG